MSDIKQSPKEGETGWLLPYRHKYLVGLEELGYAAPTISKHAASINVFIAQVELRKFSAQHIDGPVLAELRDAIPALQSADEQRGRRWYIAQFTAWLAKSGVIGSPMPHPPPEPGSLAHLATAYNDWMRHQRGLGEDTIELRNCALRRFMTFRFGAVPGDLDEITADDIRRFLDLPSTRKGYGPGLVSRSENLKCCFRFLYATGRTRRNLALCVPCVRVPATRLSRHLSPGKVQQLVDAPCDDNRFGRRDRAMLLIMARLGLRPKELVAMRLDDVNWAEGEFVVRGKGGQRERMPLPADVGEAIVDYIRHARSGKSRHLFVSIRAPHRPLGSRWVKSALHRAFAKAGLEPPNGEVRCHLMRHSLAVDMLRRGASLREVSEVLRHRSQETTTIYARYDFEALRSLARPWPVRGEMQ